ncbi:C40 family peptidase [Terribacillus sp. 7520-G]|uniref:C40 family peptidase n=1 Tax=Terribacillus sp. 7520-G TaxID=2025389 RepID=UPI001E4155EE|nr:C40 family peptidase [Terribacillus sp. 7520-G]
MKEHMIAVSVANLWTHPGSARQVDMSIAGNPADPARWVHELSHADRLELHENDLLQSQVLFGTTVWEVGKKDDWIKVVVPSQSTPKEINGYPGWIPARQLAAPLPKTDRMIEVRAKQGTLILDETGEGIPLSYLTRLPLAHESGTAFTVLTPLGPGRISKSESGFCAKRQESGSELIAYAEQFIGLDYLWGGMSSWGYDCSGFAYNMHLAGGYTIPRDASAQALEGKPIALNQAEPGDLLFFAYEAGKGSIHHVGFYHGNGKMLHAPKTGKQIEILDLADTVYETELCAIRRYWN